MASSSSTPMSEPSSAPVLPALTLDIPILLPGSDSGNGSTAQPTPTNAPVSLPPAMPQVSLTFLMISGRRRQMSFDPSITVGRVKELVWASWPQEWSDERPPAPNYLRILYLGKMLQEEDVLASIHNPLSPSGPGLSPLSPPTTTSPASPSLAQPQSTIVHLSIRPVPPAGEDDDLKKKRRRIGRTASTASGTEENGGDAGCCGGCIIC